MLHQKASEGMINLVHGDDGDDMEVMEGPA